MCLKIQSTLKLLAWDLLESSALLYLSPEGKLPIANNHTETSLGCRQAKCVQFHLKWHDHQSFWTILLHHLYGFSLEKTINNSLECYFWRNKSWVLVNTKLLCECLLTWMIDLYCPQRNTISFNWASIKGDLGGIWKKITRVYNWCKSNRPASREFWYISIVFSHWNKLFPNTLKKKRLEWKTLYFWY